MVGLIQREVRESGATPRRRIRSCSTAKFIREVLCAGPQVVPGKFVAALRVDLMFSQQTIIRPAAEVFVGGESQQMFRRRGSIVWLPLGAYPRRPA
jgi:hypothetical protein